MWGYGVWQVYNVHKCGMFYSICMFHEMHVMCVCVCSRNGRIMPSFEYKMVMPMSGIFGFII